MRHRKLKEYSRDREGVRLDACLKRLFKNTKSLIPRKCRTL